MSIFLSFPRMILHLFHIFLSFFLLLHFLLVGISFLWSSLLLPYHFLHFLVSSFFGLSLFLCFHLFMVDFSLVRLDCPSFFARLCGLLESIGRKRPKVGLFVGRDCPYRFILLFLFPLVHRLVGISQTLTMFGEEEVRSGELETGLSLFEDCGALKVTFPSTPHKAWSICCALKEKKEKRIRDSFQLYPSVRIRIPDNDDRACHSYSNEVCFYEANFVSGLRLPIYPFIRELFFRLQLAPTQFIPNSWRIVVCYMVIWMFANDKDAIRIDEFLYVYYLR